MMNLRNTLTASAAAVALMAGSSAQAGDYYFSLFGGISTFDDEIELQQSQSNSVFLGTIPDTSKVGITIKGGAVGTPYDPFSFTTTLNYLKGFTGAYSSIPIITQTPFTTSRNLGLGYVVRANVANAYNQVQNSYFNWEDDFDSGFVVGAALGQEFADGWRGELEIAYRAVDISGGGKFNRRINGHLYQSVLFTNANNYLYAAYNAGNGGFYTTAGFATGKIVVGPSLTLATKLSGLPVSTVTATAFKQAEKTALGTIPYLALKFPNAGSTTGNFSSDGEAQVWSLMANLWYDFDFMGLNPDGVNTFFGGGVGVAQLDLEYNASMGTYFGGTIGYGLDDGGMGFAYQLGAGIGFDMGNGMLLSAQYRWFGTSDIDLGSTDMRVESHNALVGLQIPLGN